MYSRHKTGNVIFYIMLSLSFILLGILAFGQEANKSVNKKTIEDTEATDKLTNYTDINKTPTSVSDSAKAGQVQQSGVLPAADSNKSSGVVENIQIQNDVLQTSGGKNFQQIDPLASGLVDSIPQAPAIRSVQDIKGYLDYNVQRGLEPIGNLSDVINSRL